MWWHLNSQQVILIRNLTLFSPYPLCITLTSLFSYVSITWPPTEEASCCLLLTQWTASYKPSPSSVKLSSSTEAINPFSFPFLSSVDSLQYYFGLLITARHEADGSGFRDAITARSPSLHCLEACLYLSPNPFCHFWPSSHYFIFFHIKLNKHLSACICLIGSSSSFVIQMNARRKTIPLASSRDYPLS